MFLIKGVADDLFDVADQMHHLHVHACVFHAARKGQNLPHHVRPAAKISTNSSEVITGASALVKS